MMNCNMNRERGQEKEARPGQRVRLYGPEAMLHVQCEKCKGELGNARVPGMRQGMQRARSDTVSIPQLYFMDYSDILLAS